MSTAFKGLTLPSGCYCEIRSKHVCASRDEPHPEHGFCAVPPQLNPGDHHYLTFHVTYWDSKADRVAGKPPVLTMQVMIGHRQFGDATTDLMPLLIEKFDAPYVGGLRDHVIDPRFHQSNAVGDVLGMLKHPHVAAIEVTT